MKNIYFLLSAGLLLASCGPSHTVVQSEPYQPAPVVEPYQPAPVMDVSYQSFYDQLSPYGSWVSYPGYGYVWIPNAGPDFRPYATNGNWIYTNAGWTWASNYNWGWAPFHYGRWFFENGYGWIWVPGNEWAPAWVSWRGGGDYYGWAPLGPGVSVNMALNSYNPPVYYWNFVPRRYMGNPGWHNHYVNQNQNVTIINNTTIINNYSGSDRNRYAYAPGPDPVEVRRVSGNNFTPVQIREANQPGERITGNQYLIYHPRVSSTVAPRGEAAGRPSTPAPARYENFSNMRPSTQYRANSQPANNQPAVNQGASNPGYTQPNTNPQPVNNPRPSMQSPVSNPPANNQPANNPRFTSQSPAASVPVNNQPANNPRFTTQSSAASAPVNSQPANNPRTVTQSPASNAPVNNQPANNPRTAAQSPASNQPVTATQPVNRNGNEMRSNRYNRTKEKTRPQTIPVAQPAQTTPQTTPQATGRASGNRNAGNSHPVQTPPASDDKPGQKPTEKPRTREADNN